MNAEPQAQYTRNHVKRDDGSIAFECSDDVAEFPWLALHPANGIVVQGISYYTSVEISRVSDRLDESKWTALTKLSWKTSATSPRAKHAARGETDVPPDDSDFGFGFTFFDDMGAQVYRMEGEGVVFRNRDFGAWRAKNKEKVAALPEPKDFQYAPPDAVGVATPVESLVTKIYNLNDAPAADALVTLENSLPPGHPFLDGSGDHVNASHMTDAAQQVACMLRQRLGRHAICHGGEVQFARYVELGRPFRIRLLSDKSSHDHFTFSIEQADENCSTIVLNYA